MKYLLILLMFFLIGGCGGSSQIQYDRELETQVWVDTVLCLAEAGYAGTSVKPNIFIRREPCREPNGAAARTCDPLTIHILPDWYGHIGVFVHEYKHAYFWQLNGEVGSHDDPWFQPDFLCRDDFLGD